MQYTRITVAFGPWNNEKFQLANATAARANAANESRKLSLCLEMDRVLRIRGWIF